MIDPKDFKKAAALLKRAAPHEWDEFVRTFEAYTFRVIGAVADAPLESVVLHQGFARQCKSLLRTYQECEIEPKGDKS